MPVSNAPLVTFRVLFGLVMVFSIIRFAVNGWIHTLYVAPTFHFTYYGFDWIAPLPGQWMYVIFAILLLSAMGITLGAYYRLSSIVFFLLFTYVELIDKANYLNHYYFVSLVSFLMIFLPAHRRFSLDAKLGWVKEHHVVAVAAIWLLRIQIGLVYCFAGLAKLHPDWLLNAQPLRIWLAAHIHKPVVGWFLRFEATAYVLSWAGMLFDMTIPFLLSLRKTRLFAYLTVCWFHLLTWWLFPIGMFPFIMIMSTLLFFSPERHEQVLKKVEKTTSPDRLKKTSRIYPALKWGLGVFMVLQLLIPFRYVLYPGDLFWTEQGYRFSWRVMLTEKAGSATFFVTDQENDKRIMVPNYLHLTPQQEKMMATQPDMIAQYGQYLSEAYEEMGMNNPKITADIFVSLNGDPRKRLIDPDTDIARVNNSWRHKSWILPR